MDSPLIIAIPVILLLISACFNVFIFVAWNNLRKGEKERREKIDHEGTPVIATVTRVIHQKEQRKYVVYAQWCSHETGKVYNFQETYKFLRGALGIRPKIYRGDNVRVNIIFNERMYRIVRRK
jgi:hypothetical protein